MTENDSICLFCIYCLVFRLIFPAVKVECPYVVALWMAITNTVQYKAAPRSFTMPKQDQRKRRVLPSLHALPMHPVPGSLLRVFHRCGPQGISRARRRCQNIVRTHIIFIKAMLTSFPCASSHLELSSMFCPLWHINHIRSSRMCNAVSERPLVVDRKQAWSGLHFHANQGHQ
jgi:hypothetical protein